MGKTFLDSLLYPHRHIASTTLVAFASAA